MDKQTFIITGGNSGIGKAVAIKIAKKNLHVVIVSRNIEKGKTALEDIKNASNNSEVELIIGNLNSINSTKALAQNILKKYSNISVLINNAGIWPTNLELNEDGLEMAFMINYLAPFILSNMLLNRLKKNAPSRIVNVNAKLYSKGKIDLKKTPFGKDFGKFKTYMNTKLCNIYFTQKFSQLLNKTNVTINANHPGVISTNLGDTNGIFGILLRQVKKLWNSPEEGADPIVWLATSPSLLEENGNYYELMVHKPYANNAQSKEIREQLWDFSKKITGI